MSVVSLIYRDSMLSLMLQNPRIRLIKKKTKKKILELGKLSLYGQRVLGPILGKKGVSKSKPFVGH